MLLVSSDFRAALGVLLCQCRLLFNGSNLETGPKVALVLVVAIVLPSVRHELWDLEGHDGLELTGPEQVARVDLLGLRLEGKVPNWVSGAKLDLYLVVLLNECDVIDDLASGAEEQASDRCLLKLELGSNAVAEGLHGVVQLVDVHEHGSLLVAVVLEGDGDSDEPLLDLLGWVEEGREVLVEAPLSAKVGWLEV